MEVKCLLGDEGCAYYTKGHVAPDVFLDALRNLLSYINCTRHGGATGAKNERRRR